MLLVDDDHIRDRMIDLHNVHWQLRPQGRDADRPELLARSFGTFSLAEDEPQVKCLHSLAHCAVIRGRDLALREAAFDFLNECGKRRPLWRQVEVLDARAQQLLAVWLQKIELTITPSLPRKERRSLRPSPIPAHERIEQAPGHLKLARGLLNITRAHFPLFGQRANHGLAL
jgi:hypothetical protein